MRKHYLRRETRRGPVTMCHRWAAEGRYSSPIALQLHSDVSHVWCTCVTVSYFIFYFYKAPHKDRMILPAGTDLRSEVGCRSGILLQTELRLTEREDISGPGSELFNPRNAKKGYYLLNANILFLSLSRSEYTLVSHDRYHIEGGVNRKLGPAVRQPSFGGLAGFS